MEKEAAIEVEEEVEKALEKEYSSKNQAQTSKVESGSKRSENEKLKIPDISEVEKTVPKSEDVSKSNSKVL